LTPRRCATRWSNRFASSSPFPDRAGGQYHSIVSPFWDATASSKRVGELPYLPPHLGHLDAALRRRDTKALVATDNWRDERSAARYAHAVAREEWKRVDDLPALDRKSGDKRSA